MKFFGKITLVLSLFSFSSAFAQQVAYSLNDGNGQALGQIVFNYKLGGYEATMNGERLAMEASSTTATATMGKLVITMPIDGSYYHNRVGQWRITSVTTSFGDKGLTKMFYAGMVPGGRLYREELWLNGRLFNRSETVIDHNDHIVWSVATDSQGTLRLSRF